MVVDRLDLPQLENEWSEQNYRGLKPNCCSRTLQQLPRAASLTKHPIATSSTLNQVRVNAVA